MKATISCDDKASIVLKRFRRQYLSKPEIIRDAALDWLEWLMNSPRFEWGLRVAIVLAGTYIIGPALWRIVFK